MTPLPDNYLAIAQRFGIDFIVSGYGSTEVGVGFFGVIDIYASDSNETTDFHRQIRDSYQSISPAMLVAGDQVNRKGFMGVPNPLIDVAVLNEQEKPVGINESGRLAFKSFLPGLMLHEYFNKPELTAESIRDGWYHSPDIAQYDQAGVYYFQDRIQGFIRVRGENVSASAVEYQLNKHPAIERSAVIGIPASEGKEQEIVAFVIKANNEMEIDNQLQGWIEQSLPKFMQPKYLRVVKSFPVTKTFKVEKHKLEKQFLDEISG